ncbi:ABC transporter ATP-binding protein [Limibaculum sp. FT325]|uniref:ABC transporter ATP-binding protein n=1 Tax=Thermohalobaculum sediminis TaxID=2939436 RepID=UPI0020BEFECE|nr:ABC transporter ATP-binding protein [Limibaculum sediminis]MCL5775482.1 ABC transporter ATP-binding protein [Limibaculum sediminis]
MPAGNPVIRVVEGGKPPPRLALECITVRFDGVAAVDDLSLEVGAGELVCLLGPSGCGKSTTLRVAAGVERQSMGRVLVDGRVVSDDRLHAPPEARSVGLMFQDFALFPHLTVAENVGFGLRRGVGADERAATVRDYLRRVGLSGYERKYPHQLSGGEQQRVALARALAPRPRVMLMDEPYSGLDNRLRDEVRDESLSILKEEGAGVLLVTHDPDEAMRMSDRIALMREGRIVQVGAAYHIYNYPRDRAAAAFFSDLNVIHGVVRARQTDTPFGLFLTPGLVDGADVEIIVRPQHLKVTADKGQEPALSPEDGIAARGRVMRARFVGAQSLIEVAMDHDGQVLRATVPHAWLPEPGTPVWLSMRRDRCFVFPCERQSRVATPYAAAAE